MAKPKAVAEPTVSLGGVSFEKPQEGDRPQPQVLVELGGMPEGSTVEVTLFETDGTDDGSRRPKRELGKIAGKLAGSAPGAHGWFGIKLDAPLPTRDQALEGVDNAAKEVAPVLRAVITTPDGPAAGFFKLDDREAARYEGDYWEVSAELKSSYDGKIRRSGVRRISRMLRAVPPGLSTHPPRAGNRLKFYNDGCADVAGSEGALKEMVDSIRAAKHFVFAADWSFHPLFRPLRTGTYAAADTSNCIGTLLIEKANEGVTVAVHTWDHTDVGAGDAQNDDGLEILRGLAKKVSVPAPTSLGLAASFALSGGDLPGNLHWRKSSRSGALDALMSSHHQKMLVVDCEEADGRRGIRVFLGGLDLTKGRFDHSDHPVAPPPRDEAGDAATWAYAQRWASGPWQVDEWYNAETDGDRSMPRQPWHDVHAQLEGPAAWDYLREFVGRWLAVDGKVAEDNSIWKLYLSLLDQQKFVPFDKPLTDGHWTVQVCRSLEQGHWSVKLPKRTLADLDKGHHWSKAYGFEWRLAESREQSILHAYRQSIDQAERFIYIENQYFIGSGKHWGYDAAENDIPERLVGKILERKKAGKNFHVYVVMPMFPEGDPVSASLCELRACEYETIRWMITTLNAEIGTDWEKYLSFYFLANWKAVPRKEWITWESNTAHAGRKLRLQQHQRYMIYVHSKLMIVDDRFLILGSCNINDRGLSGNGDSEVVISAWPRLNHREKCIGQIRDDLRKKLWTEHFGAAGLPAAWKAPESEACVKAVKSSAFQNYKAFREMTQSGTEGHLCLWNYAVDGDELTLKKKEINLGVVSDIKGPEDDMCLPDSPHKGMGSAEKEGWCWKGKFKLFIPRTLVK